MTKFENSRLPDGGEEGMNEPIYKGMLVDQKKLLLELRKMAVKSENTEIIEKIDEEVEAIETKLAY